MLPREKRLNLKTDFKWVAAGKKAEGKFLKLFIKTGENKVARVGVAVSFKSFRKATDRNRAKRLTFQAFRSVYSRLPSNINIVALPKHNITGVKSADVLSDLESILNEKNLN